MDSFSAPGAIRSKDPNYWKSIFSRTFEELAKLECPSADRG
jgi:hypothetical protein